MINNRRTICILGGTGTVGVTACKVLSKLGYSLRVSVRNIETIKDTGMYMAPNIQLFELDIDKESNIGKFFKGSDLVIGAIGPSADYSEKMLLEAMAENIPYVDPGGIHLIRKMRNSSMKGTAIVGSGIFPGLSGWMLSSVLKEAFNDDLIEMIIGGVYNFSKAAAIDYVEEIKSYKAGIPMACVRNGKILPAQKRSPLNLPTRISKLSILPYVTEEIQEIIQGKYMLNIDSYTAAPVLYVKDGEIEREYTPAEFDSLSDGTRKEMGLRPFSLSKLKPANQYQAHTAKQMEFQNFCFAYKKREPESLHIPSAELPVGETIAIIGLNGAGKSTLARCICGLEKKCGFLQVEGKTLDWKARLKHCYMVMQDTSHQLFTESVADEVLLSMDNKDETVVDKILKQFDLLEYKDRHPLSLSGGQKQRVAIASAIVSNREIIVFDEPTSGLDLKHMREVARSLKSLADQGKTLLVITHDPELVMAGCSYVVHMEKGQIKESYPLDESGSKKVLDFFRIRQ